MPRRFLTDEAGYLRIFGKFFEIDLEIHWSEWMLGFGCWRMGAENLKIWTVTLHVGPPSGYLYWGEGVDDQARRAHGNIKVMKGYGKSYCDEG